MNAMIPLLFLAAMPGQPAAGDLVAATPVVDRGEVRSGPLLSQTYELKNTGSTPLAIGETTVGCGCGRLALSGKSVEPGSTVKLTLTLNTLALPEGPANWAVTVRYASVPKGKFSPEVFGQTELTLRLKANILREISIDPPVLALTTAGPVTQAITFTDRRTTPTRITKAVTSNAHFTLELRDPIESNGIRKQEIVWKVAESLPAGLHEETIVFATGDPSCPELRVPVKVTKRAADGIEATPAAPRIVCVPGEAEASVRVQLRAGGKPLSILQATSKNPGVSVKFSEGIGAVAVVRMIVKPSEAGASGTAEVVVTLAEPKGKVITIPVSW